MESLVRLGKTYVQLCHDGCVLFLDWTVEFLCDAGRPVCCVSEFAKQGKLKGHRTLHGHLPAEDRHEDVEVQLKNRLLCACVGKNQEETFAITAKNEFTPLCHLIVSSHANTPNSVFTHEQRLSKSLLS
jgi:hypothetical protein